MAGPEPAAEQPNPPRTAAGTAAGCFLVGLMHLTASLLVIFVGGLLAREGSFAVFFFWLGLGLFQWIYLLPASRLARARGFSGLNFGIRVGALLTLGLNGLIVLMNIAGPLQEKITGNTPANTLYSGRDSVVVSMDPAQVVVREGGEGDGGPAGAETEAFALEPATRFGFLGPGFSHQKRPPGPDWLTPGRRVSIDYVLKNRKKTALYVKIWVDAAEP